jgi:hypothetical protein
MKSRCRVTGLKFQVSSFKFQVPGFRCRVTGVGGGVSGFKFQVSSLKSQVSGSPDL